MASAAPASGQVSPRSARSATQRRAPRAGVVGPNAVIQLAHALAAAPELGSDAAARVFTAAGLPHLLTALPQDMVDERVPRALFDALYATVPAGDAQRIASDAGRRTADYIIANRIPAVARRILPHLPPPLAARILLKAIARASWTFAGSGVCTVGPGLRVRIANNPLALPGCPWHCAVFERLMQRLVAPAAMVRSIACCHEGAPACAFIMDLAGNK